MKRARRIDANKAVADYLKSAIASRGTSALALAERAGIGQSNLSRFLNGEQSTTIDSLDRLAGALNVTLADMLSGVPPPELPPQTVEQLADAKLVARLATAFAKCDQRDQRLVLDLAERLAKDKA